MKKHFTFFTFILIFILYSCDDSTGKDKNKSQNTFDYKSCIGKITNQIAYENNSITYSLFVPPNIDRSLPAPVLFLFDPQGKGDLPVSKYKDLAVKFGYILVGSNNSKNGMSFEEINEDANKMFEDVFTKVVFDRKKIFTAGFSGGSRSAISVAINRNDVSGVIGCSAGFPVGNFPSDKKFSFIGFAGNTDFNYLEMVAFDKVLEKNNIIHQLVVFDGKHEWPTKECMEDGFIWLEFNSMKNNLTPRNDTLINNFIKSNESKIAELKSKNSTYEIYTAYKKMISFLGGLTDVNNYKSELAKVEATPELKKILAKNEMLLKEEFTKCQQYSNNLNSKDINWWMKEINTIISKTKNNTDRETQLMNKRLLAFLSISAYSNSNAILNSNQPEQADKFLKIYAMVDPENPDCHYFTACYYAKLNEKEKALSSLEKAVEFGFNDIQKIHNNTDFHKIRGMEKFAEIISKIKVKNEPGKHMH
ncbi:MAG: hypothetical protein PHD97_01540 [Bacteroidales bacterium]|nr:hypothetical protein [Bacteroidales bacterium]